MQVENPAWPHHWGCSDEGKTTRCVYEQSDLVLHANGKELPFIGQMYCADCIPVTSAVTVVPAQPSRPGNIWDRCAEFAVASGRANHDHGHGDVAALILEHLLKHLQDHTNSGVENDYFKGIVRTRAKDVEQLLRKDRVDCTQCASREEPVMRTGVPNGGEHLCGDGSGNQNGGCKIFEERKTEETPAEAAARIDGKNVTIRAKADENQRLYRTIGFKTISEAILKKYGVITTGFTGRKFQELGVFNVVVYVGVTGTEKATVKVWIVQDQ